MKHLWLFSLLILLAACTPESADDATIMIEPTAAIEVTSPGGAEAPDPTPMPVTATVASVPTGTPIPGELDEVGQPGFSAVINNGPRLSIESGSYRWALDARHYLDNPDNTPNIDYSLRLSDDDTAYSLRLGLSELASGEYNMLEYTPDAEGAFASVTVPQGDGEVLVYEQFPDGTISLNNDGLLMDGTFDFRISTIEDPGDAPEIIRVRGSFQNMPVRE
jgi:hypothetical protein